MEQADEMQRGVATGVREKCGVKITSYNFHPSPGAEKMHLRWIPKSRMSRKFALPPCILFYVDNLFARCPQMSSRASLMNELVSSARDKLYLKV